jgi:DsbC/DsbD-like thiol-disulfide interchange protein
MLRAVALALALVSPAAAAAGPAKVRLIEGWRDGPRHVVGVEIVLPAGWHTYWRAPGSVGIAPRFDWSGSGNLGGAQVEWPHPEVFESFGARTIGYHDRVVLPVVLTPREADAPIEIDLTLSFGVCKDVCIPASARLEGSLGAGAADGEGRAALAAALSRRARSGPEGGVVDATCALRRNGAGHDLAATVRLRAAPGRDQIAVIEADGRPDLWIGEAEARTEGPVVVARAPLEAAGGPAGAFIDRDGLTLTLIDHDRTVEIRGCRAPG